MSVILLNSSPRGKNGNTGTALLVVAEELKIHGFESEYIEIGNCTYKGCQACGACIKLGGGKCAFSPKDLPEEKSVDIIAEKLANSQGFVIGSPVYYAGINGTLKSFLDRAFYISGGKFRFKPVAAVVSARRSGITASLEQIYKYFEIAECLVAPTNYWSGVHGGAMGQAAEDAEGLQTAKIIGRNLAFLINLLEKSETLPPEREQKIQFNFIRP